MSVKEESEKASLKLNIQKIKIVASGPITSWQIEKGKVEAMTYFISWAPKLLWTVTSATFNEIKRCLFLGRKAMTNLLLLLPNHFSRV